MRSSNVRSWMKLGAVALALGACNNPVVPADANHMGLDTGADAGGPALPTLPAAAVAGGAAMLGCAATAPAPGAPISITMELDSFGQSGDTADMVDICFCPDNVLSAQALGADVSGGCGTCQHATSDANGRATLMANTNGWYAYRVFFHSMSAVSDRTTFLDSIQVNEPAPATVGGMVTGNAVSRLTANLISEAELITRQHGTTTIAGRVYDCHGDDVSNAIVRAFHADGTEILEGEQTAQSHFRYFDGNQMPDSSATFTNTDGLYVVVNATPAMNGELIRMEAWAYTGTGTGAPTRVGCEAVQALTDGVAIVNVGPTRTDYPAGHPCASH